MFKPNLEMSADEISAVIDHLPQKDKIRLIEKLEQSTLKARWKKILNNIDARLKRFPLTQKEVLKEITAYRQEKYAQGRH